MENLVLAADESPRGYEGAQYDLVLRFVGLYATIGAAVSLGLLAFFPPTVAFGWAGWPLTVPFALLGVLSGVRTALLRVRLAPPLVSAIGIIGIIQLGLLEWFAGGGHAPYTQLILLSAFGSAGGQPPRRCLAMGLLALGSALSPALYSHIDVVQVVVEFGVVTVLAVATSYVFTTTRAHRARLQDAHELASTLAHRDALTGLPNRRAFDAALAEVTASRRERDAAAHLLLCDVDDFKSINDRFGHLAGDLALCGVARALTRSLRPPDAAYRWAGDEFAVILRETSPADAALVAERIRSTVAESCRLDDGTPVRVSIGLTAAVDAGGDRRAILDRADRALLAEKHGTSVDRGQSDPAASRRSAMTSAARS